MTSSTMARINEPATGPENLQRVRDLLAANGRKVVVLDDDPTGTQTVHGVPVLTAWDRELLMEAFAEPGPGFFVLTNTRALRAEEAADLTREIATNLRAAAADAGVDFAVVSRSDSTLRGHFPLETDVLAQSLEQPVAATILIPAFIEGGRVTAGGVHYLSENGSLVPVSETEFARDATFGFRNAVLALWVEEKSSGRIDRSSVVGVTLPLLRGERGVDAVTATLLAVPPGSVVAVDATAYADLEVFAAGLLQAEARGRRYVIRSAASFARVRLGLDAQAVLDASAIVENSRMGGLVVVGSYVDKTTRQLREAMTLSNVVPVEMAVDRLAFGDSGEAEMRRVAAAAEDAIRRGLHALVYTSRGTESALGRAGELSVARSVSAAVVKVVQSIRLRPRFLIAKGGITSSDIATSALGIRRATVLGQAAPGVPVWRTGPESRYPGLAYVIFPGNVGGPGALKDIMASW